MWDFRLPLPVFPTLLLVQISGFAQRLGGPNPQVGWVHPERWVAGGGLRQHWRPPLRVFLSPCLVGRSLSSTVEAPPQRWTELNFPTVLN